MKTAETSLWIKPDLPLAPCRSDRDRDIFDLGNTLLVVASDRISAADRTFPEGIPDKGRLLTRIARFWSDSIQDIVQNHLAAPDLRLLPPSLLPFRESLEGRSLLVRKLKPIAVGCTVRGYLAGSAFEDYVAEGSVSGIMLPPRLKMAARLPEPIFTPFVRAEDGRRRNITMAEMMNRVGVQTTRKLKECSLALYMRGYHLAWERDIILADARFEFGQFESGRLVLTDEALTPGMCRYWAEDRWKPGSVPPSLDRRCLQGYLDAQPHWDETPPAPHLPQDIVDGIRSDHIELARRFGITP